VSALVHSSTLVTAGVYLLIRFNYVLNLNMYLFYIGRLTIFMSGVGANYETDLKRIIALSTLRQLGLIIITLGLGMIEFSFFHLITHAMFKSLLFLCAGVFIHSIADTQDIRMLGNLFEGLPVTSLYSSISFMALRGFPFLAGFYSKDSILELFIIRRMNTAIFIIIILRTILTVTYSIRLSFIIFLNNKGLKSLVHISEERGIIGSMRVLLILSVFFGCFFRVNFFPVNIILLSSALKNMIFAFMMVLFVINIIFYTKSSSIVFPLTSGFVYYLGSI